MFPYKELLSVPASTTIVWVDVSLDIAKPKIRKIFFFLNVYAVWDMWILQTPSSKNAYVVYLSLFLSLSIYISLSLSLFLSLSLCSSSRVFICSLFSFLSFCLTSRLDFAQSSILCLFISISVQFISLSICLFVCLSVCNVLFLFRFCSLL